MVEPPSLAGAAHETSTLVVLPTAAPDTAVGESGTVATRTAEESADGRLSPDPFVATTANV
jgi:hypothetical protein